MRCMDSVLEGRIIAYSELGGVDGFDQDEARGDCDDGCAVGKKAGFDFAVER